MGGPGFHYIACMVQLISEFVHGLGHMDAAAEALSPPWPKAALEVLEVILSGLCRWMRQQR